MRTLVVTVTMDCTHVVKLWWLRSEQGSAKIFNRKELGLTVRKCHRASTEFYTCRSLPLDPVADRTSCECTATLYSCY